MLHADAFESHGNWWRDAGLDVAIAEQPVRWLKKAGEPEAHAENPIEQIAKPVLVVAQSENPAPQVEQAAPWPEKLQNMQNFIATEKSCPGANYGRRRALPLGNADARLIILSDMPESADLDAGHIFSGTDGILLDAMLRAINVRREDAYIFPIACTRPASGEIAESDHQMLADFTHHHLKLHPASHILLLGDMASRLCLNGGMLEKRGNLHSINHDGRTMAAINCFHPRTLLARAAFKKQAWQDLQLLMKELNR